MNITLFGYLNDMASQQAVVPYATIPQLLDIYRALGGVFILSLVSFLLLWWHLSGQIKRLEEAIALVVSSDPGLAKKVSNLGSKKPTNKLGEEEGD